MRDMRMIRVIGVIRVIRVKGDYLDGWLIGRVGAHLLGRSG